MISSSNALESNWGISGTASLFAAAATAAVLVLGLYALFGLVVVVSTVFDILV
jgi:hypothetical protein